MEAATADCSSWQEPKQADCATRLQQADCDYPSTAKVWQTLNIGKAPGIPNNLIIFGAVHGQMSRHCLGVVCQTLLVLRYNKRIRDKAAAAQKDVRQGCSRRTERQGCSRLTERQQAAAGGQSGGRLQQVDRAAAGCSRSALFMIPVRFGSSKSLSGWSLRSAKSTGSAHPVVPARTLASAALLSQVLHVLSQVLQCSHKCCMCSHKCCKPRCQGGPQVADVRANAAASADCCSAFAHPPRHMHRMRGSFYMLQSQTV